RDGSSDVVSSDLEAGKTLVDRPVAIVVEVVADLRRGARRDRVHARDRAVDAGRLAGRADPGRARSARDAAARIALVDRAVAIVVDAVADLGPGEHLTEARAELTAGAGLHAGRARPSSDGAGWAVVARSSEREPRLVLVDADVAVVVDAVAALRLHGPGRATHHRAVLARRHAARARAGHPGRAHEARSRIALVDHAVAVVVDAVADLVRALVRPLVAVVAVEPAAADADTMIITVHVHADALADGRALQLRKRRYKTHHEVEASRAIRQSRQTRPETDAPSRGERDAREARRAVGVGAARFALEPHDRAV